MKLYGVSDPAIAIYNIIEGIVIACEETDLVSACSVPFVLGMWIGEEALAAPGMSRNETVLCQNQCSS